MTGETTTLYCYVHPDRETGLRCNRCERPICADCAVLTPTGYRCKECVREQKKVFDTAEWQAVYLVTQRKRPPETPPSLDQMVRLVAGLGGFLNRKHDRFPGPQVIWIGL